MAVVEIKLRTNFEMKRFSGVDPFSKFSFSLTMAAVYKQLTKGTSSKAKDIENEDSTVQNKQRVLMLSSRGITYRYDTNVGGADMKTTTFNE
jgi:hypothetical protein